MSELLEVAKVVVSPCEKLIDAISQAIGTAYEPRHIKKMAEARAFEITAISEAIRNSVDLPISYNNGEIALNSADVDAFVRRTAQRIGFQELLRQNNLDSVFDNAYSILEGETAEESESDKHIENDWMLRFINCAQDVTDEEMQLLWSKVLAGEIKHPKSYSLRTLETLRNLSKEEATTFQKLCHIAIQITDEAIFIPRYQEFIKENGVSYAELFLMADCGLINYGESMVLTQPVEKDESGITICGAFVLLVSSKNEENGNITICQYPLTEAGKELYKLSEITTSENTFLSFAELVKKKNNSLNITAHRLLGIENNEVRFDPSDLLQ